MVPGTADLAFNENIAVHATEGLASGNAVALVVGRSGARKSGWRNTGGGVRNPDGGHGRCGGWAKSGSADAHGAAKSSCTGSTRHWDLKDL